MSFFEELKRRNVVRVGVAYAIASWVLLQVADLVLEAIEAPAWVLQALMLVVGLGFIAALVIAWAYEMTPEGIKKESDVDRSQSIAGDTGKKLDKIVIGFLVLAVGVLLIERSMDKEPSAPIADAPPPVSQISETPEDELPLSSDLNSVAVLPFANMSADADNEYFSDGISEELLNLLVRIDGLRVPSRTSSFAFKGMNMDIKDIASQLQVVHILEGSVRKAGNRVRVTAQLIDVSTDTHLWSNTYDRELEDIFGIQDEIANSIVDALKLVLGTGGLASRASDKPTENLSAYEDYLRGRHLFMLRGIDNLNRSLELLQSAVKKDALFSEAWAQLSQTAITVNGWNPENEIGADQIALDAGLTALELDPESAAAMAGIAFAYYDMLRWHEAFDMLERATRLAKDSTPIYWHGLILQSAGYLQEARSKLLAAEKIDPVYPQLQYWIGVNDLAQGDNKAARTRFLRTIEGSNPNGELGMYVLTIATGNMGEAGKWQNQITLQSSSAQLSTQNAQILQQAITTGSVTPEAIQVAIEETDVSYLAHAGAFDEILKLTNDSVAQGENTGVFNDVGRSFWSPAFKPMRQLPEFKAFLRNTGLVDFWKSRGWPDLCKPVGDDDFECD